VSTGALYLLGVTGHAFWLLFIFCVLASYFDHPTMTWIEPDGAIHDRFAGLEAHARVSREGAEHLFAASGKSLVDAVSRADSGKRPGSYPLNTRVRIAAVSTHETVDSSNVVGIIHGSDPALSREFVTLVAHLDHVGIGKPVEGDEIYNGAYDNASGVAAMIAVARALGRMEISPARSIVFIAVTGEEKGLLGADYFARYPTAPVGEVVAAFSLDMFLMLFPLHDIVAYGAEHSSLSDDVDKAAAALGLIVSPDPVPEEVLFVRTDHYPFVKLGIPSLYIDHGLESGDESIDGEALVRKWMKNVYHRPSDDLNQTFEWQAGADFAKLNLLLTWEVASDPARPAWNEGDFFGERFGRSGR
ncbi:MAG: M20/M25/M40 family metallo-hydrolase, partial [Thermoanaerobaculia bacterium]|nr:M20/M25/M40 family metallo-hydrolase [Thermoanaerobaculia bacterium]